ncbi:MAG: hypothetical protein ABI910_09575 [Gemmatimonadota bacterium]
MQRRDFLLTTALLWPVHRPLRDTTRSNPLIALAQNADVVVHEVMIPSAVDRLIANVPNAPDLKRSTLSHHISAGDAGRVAPAAGVKTLVLSHLIPAEDPAVPESARIEAARQHFGGTIVVGRDLMEIQALGATPPRHARSAYRRRCPPPRRLMMIGREMTVE